jgi:hypothetical protein
MAALAPAAAGRRGWCRNVPVLVEEIARQFLGVLASEAQYLGTALAALGVFGESAHQPDNRE